MLEVIYVAMFLSVMCAAGVVALKPSGPPLPRLSEKRRSVGVPLLAAVGKACARFLKPATFPGNQPVGTSYYLTPEELTGMKVLAGLAGLVISVVILRETGAINPLFVVLGGAIGFVSPELWVKSRLKRRQRVIVKLLPEVIDLLSLCVEAGMDFLVSLQKVIALKQFQGEPLIQELSAALQEMKLGRRKAEALREMAQRVDVPELTSFIRAVVITDRMGTSMAQVLGTHSEDVRFQRRIRAERTALKAPVKLLIPLIFCIMPCVAILVGGPILLQFMRQSPFGK